MSKKEVVLEELCGILNGYAFDSTKFSATEGIPLIRIRDLKNSGCSLRFTGEYDKKYLVRKGDLLIGMDGEFQIFEWKGVPSLLNQRVCKIIPKEGLVDKNYLLHRLKADLEAIEENTAFTTVKHISSYQIAGIRWRELPNVSTQKRIGQELNSQLEIVETARVAAVDAGDEMKRLLMSLMEREVVRALNSNTNEVCLADVIEIDSKLVNPTKLKYCELLHVSAENIESVSGRLINLKSAKEDGMMSGKYLFDKGDVLYSKLRPYLRKVALANFTGLCSADMYPLKCNKELLNSRFLKLLLTSELFTEYANEKSARSRMPKLNREQLFAWHFSLPSLDVQEDCIKKVELAIEHCQTGSQASGEILKDINILPKKLLKQAFEI